MVSVVIGIYNVSEYIERGMGYILSQDYQTFEVILVDDGSTDGSAEICDKWVEKDSRVRVLHKENAGLGSARNAGLDLAKGEYVYFFDVDDKVPQNLLTDLVIQMEESNAEMMVFGYDNIDVKNKTISTVTFKHRLLECNEALCDVFVDEFVLKMNGFVWNKMYRKSFLDKYHLKFENQRIQQDEVFNLKCYKYVKRLLLSDCKLYEYYIYDKGNTRSHFIPDRFDIYKSVNYNFNDLVYNYWNISDERMNDYLQKRFFLSVKQCLSFNLFHKECPWSQSDKQKEICRIISDKSVKDNFEYMFNYQKLSLEDKIYIKTIPRIWLMQMSYRLLLALKTIRRQFL